jgi:3-oxoacyl-[acyl-carrier-protein] synthase II
LNESTRVVVTGLGAVAPNGMGVDAFWTACREGRSGVGTIDLFDPSPFPTTIAGQVSDLDAGAVLDPRDLRHVPRTVPMALMAAREALADARLDPRDLSLDERRAFGVVVGTGGGGLEFTERMYALWYRGEEKKGSIYTIPSSTPGTLSSELSMAFDLRGFSHVVSTGCTSSTDALGLALDRLRLGRVERVLVGGVDAPLAPGIMAGFSAMKVMTGSWNHDPERGSRPFSRDRDGFVLGEGAWFLVLERREVARDRGGREHAAILGYGSTCEAFHRVRLDESGEEPARAMTLALEEAGVAPEEVDYLNLHGTATVLNDRIETRALKLALGKAAYRTPGSSLKSMIGHPQGACGAAGVVQTIKALQDGFLPPTLNLDEPDPECDLDYVPREGRPAELRTALCNCIGFGSRTPPWCCAGRRDGGVSALPRGGDPRPSG